MKKLFNEYINLQLLFYFSSLAGNLIFKIICDKVWYDAPTGKKAFEEEYVWSDDRSKM